MSRGVSPCPSPPREVVYSVSSRLSRIPWERPTVPSFSRRIIFLLCTTSFLLLAPLSAQDSADRIFFHAQVFAGNPENPYAEAVAIRGDKILAVGNLQQVEKEASPSAERIDLGGKTLFPGFIDSHSHSIDGGLSLIGADASDKVFTLAQLPPFVAKAKKTGRGMRGDILEIQGMPLAFWSHPDVLNADFSTGAYARQCILL